MQIRSATFVISNSDVAKCPNSHLPEYAFIGRSNVGKSSLINALCNKKNLAKTSSRPGKTQLINHFLINQNWHLVDLPGFGYARVSKTQKKVFQKFITNYFKERKQLVNAFLLIDIRHEPQPIDMKFMEWLGENFIPFSIIFTKADKLSSDYIESNVKRLKFIISNTRSKLIYASSVAIYGDLSEIPHSPSEKLNIINTYSKSKFECEKLVLQAGGVVARLSNIYGPGMSKKNIISDILKQIKVKGIDSINIIDGSPIRDMIHISDVTSCLLSMTKIQKKGIYNIATGTSISMKDLALMILKVANFEEYKLMELKHNKTTSCISLDISNTKKTFAWSPSISLQDGLKELV